MLFTSFELRYNCLAVLFKLLICFFPELNFTYLGFQDCQQEGFLLVESSHRSLNFLLKGLANYSDELFFIAQQCSHIFLIALLTLAMNMLSLFPFRVKLVPVIFQFLIQVLAILIQPHQVGMVKFLEFLFTFAQFSIIQM